MSALTQAKALHKIKKAYRKGLLKKSLSQSKLGSAAAKQDHYIIKIHLTTDKTGKRKIEFIKSMLSNVPGSDTPWVSPQFPDQFSIKRTPNKAPYAKKPIKGKNEEWDTLNKNIEQMLNEIFKTGHQIRLPNPIYPNNRKRDLIFKISQYIWKKRPHSSALGNYKFVIDKDEKDDLIVNINVKLEGAFIKGEHQIGAPAVALAPPKHFGERITRACDAHLKAVRELVNSYYESKKFEKRVKRSEAEQALYHTAQRTRRRRHHRRERPMKLGAEGPVTRPRVQAPPPPPPSPWKGGNKNKSTRHRRKRKTRRRRTRRKR